MAMALFLVKIDARRAGHMRFCQHGLGHADGVRGFHPQRADIGIDVERPFAGRHVAQKILRQAADQKIAIFAITRDLDIQQSIIVKGGDGPGLHRARRADIHILRQPFDRIHQIRRENGPADAPACHREEF